MTNETRIREELSEKLYIEVMEDYVVTAELGHLAKNQDLHKFEMRKHFARLLDFIYSETERAMREERERIAKEIEERGMAFANTRDKESIVKSISHHIFSNPRQNKEDFTFLGKALAYEEVLALLKGDGNGKQI